MKFYTAFWIDLRFGFSIFPERLITSTSWFPFRLAMRFPILSTASKRRPLERFAKHMQKPLLHFFGEIDSGPIANTLFLSERDAR